MDVLAWDLLALVLDLLAWDLLALALDLLAWDLFVLDLVAWDLLTWDLLAFGFANQHSKNASAINITYNRRKTQHKMQSIRLGF